MYACSKEMSFVGILKEYQSKTKVSNESSESSQNNTSAKKIFARKPSPNPTLVDQK